MGQLDIVESHDEHRVKSATFANGTFNCKTMGQSPVYADELCIHSVLSPITGTQ